LIIFRYLSRELLITSLAVSAILLTIFLSQSFSRFLDDAAQGRLAVDALFSIILFRMPHLLELILPLGFFLSILLVYGRMYIESEMVVLSACGMSQSRLFRMTLVPAALVAVLVALFSFWLSPLGASMTERILAEQRNRSEIESLQQGRFQAIAQGRVMTYIEDISDTNELKKVFVAQQEGEGKSVVVIAETGEQKLKEEFGQRYLILHQGFRYEGQPGTSDFTITGFNEWGRYLPPAPSIADLEFESDARTTIDLLANPSLENQAALQWRIAMPLMVFIATLLAVPLSKTNPRQGRYFKMLPAILIYVFYLTFLLNANSKIMKGQLDPDLGLWLVHLTFLLIALTIFNWRKISSIFYFTRGAAHA
jgi:lipopolysaccharide export system permease protein